MTRAGARRERDLIQDAGCWMGKKVSGFRRGIIFLEIRGFWGFCLIFVKKVGQCGSIWGFFGQRSQRSQPSQRSQRSHCGFSFSVL